MKRQARNFKLLAETPAYFHATVDVKWLFKETTQGVYSFTNGSAWYWLDNGSETGQRAMTLPSIGDLHHAYVAKYYLDNHLDNKEESNETSNTTY